MSKTESIALWSGRIQSRKLSGLKVNDWCNKTVFLEMPIITGTAN